MLDSKLSYEHHLQYAFSRISGTIAFLRKLQDLVTIWKSLIRPHIDFADLDYDWTSNELFHQSLEPLQYTVAIAITGTFKGTSSEKFFQKLGLETLKSRI